MEPVQLAAVLAAAVVLASMLSVELGIAVALFELGLGVAVGNVFHLHPQQWLDFIASFASIVLTFLAGLEVEPAYFRERLGASISVGLVSLMGPFVVASLVAYGLLDWSVKASRSQARHSRPPRSRSSTPCSSKTASTRRGSASS